MYKCVCLVCQETIVATKEFNTMRDYKIYSWALQKTIQRLSEQINCNSWKLYWQK